MTSEPVQGADTERRNAQRRADLKTAGWRRFDRAAIGERWRAPDDDSALGVSLATAWRKHRAQHNDGWEVILPCGHSAKRDVPCPYCDCDGSEK